MNIEFPPTFLNVALVCCSVWALTGCDSLSDPLPPEPINSGALVQNSAGTSANLAGHLQVLAKLLAQGLSDESVRHQLAAAVQRSPWHEHKLVLPDLLDTPMGKALLSATARSSSYSEEVIESTIRALPALDFYLPFDDQRHSWAGEPVAILATADQDQRLIEGFDHFGNNLRYRTGGPPPAPHTFVLHPAEAKHRRATVHLDHSHAVSADSQPGTHLDYFKIFFDDGIGDVELRFVALLIDGTDFGHALDTLTMNVPGFAEVDNVDHMFFTDRIPEGSGVRVVVYVEEDDGFEDDYYGWVHVDATENGDTVNVYDGTQLTAQIQLEWEPQDSQNVASVYISPDPINVPVDGSKTAFVTAKDQYGYWLNFTGTGQAALDAWWTVDTSVATVGSAVEQLDKAYFPVYAETEYALSTTLFAKVKVNGTDDSTYVSVHVDGEACPPLEPC